MSLWTDERRKRSGRLSFKKNHMLYFLFHVPVSHSRVLVNRASRTSTGNRTIVWEPLHKIIRICKFIFINNSIFKNTWLRSFYVNEEFKYDKRDRKSFYLNLLVEGFFAAVMNTCENDYVRIFTIFKVYQFFFFNTSSMTLICSQITSAMLIRNSIHRPPFTPPDSTSRFSWLFTLVFFSAPCKHIFYGTRFCSYRLLSNLPQEFMAIFMITFCRSLCRWSYFVSWWYGTSNWAYYCRHWTAWGLTDHLLRFFAWLVEPFMALFNAFVFVTVAQICFDVELMFVKF